jgi:molybdenum cofactor biosynthesis enzyme MoaA
MKLRTERSGYHWFDRRTGIHVLLDEVSPDPGTVSIAPRSLSVALWNVCDLKCRFCYRPEGNDALPPEFVTGIAAAADELGSLEITFGGGEPLSYPHLVSVCEWIWANTSLGISVTTHGHRLTSGLASRLAGRISSIRFSVDGDEPYYSEIRGRPLANLLRNINFIREAVPFGINVVVSPSRTRELRRVAELAVRVGSADLLIIPEHRQGKILLSEHEWSEVEQVIMDYRSQLCLYVTSAASSSLGATFLPTEAADEFMFAHVSADRKLKLNSYEPEGIAIDDPSLLRGYFMQLLSRD